MWVCVPCFTKIKAVVSRIYDTLLSNYSCIHIHDARLKGHVRILSNTLSVNYILVCVYSRDLLLLYKLSVAGRLLLYCIWMSTDNRIILCNIIIKWTVKLLSDIAL